jgi:hypothetical protein
VPKFYLYVVVEKCAIMTDAYLTKLQQGTFGYFLHETNPASGLTPDNTREEAPATITAVGLGLAAYTVGVERGFLTRDEAIRRTLTTLRFFWNSPQGDGSDATGYQGFYYHFLDMDSGRRTWNSELSTIDSTYLLAGALAAAAYFSRDTRPGRRALPLRQLAVGAQRRAGRFTRVEA